MTQYPLRVGAFSRSLYGGVPVSIDLSMTGYRFPPLLLPNNGVELVISITPELVVIEFSQQAGATCSTKI